MMILPPQTMKRLSAVRKVIEKIKDINSVLRVLCNSALVPLMMSTLTKRDITEIASPSDLFEVGVTIEDEGSVGPDIYFHYQAET